MGEVQPYGRPKKRRKGNFLKQAGAKTFRALQGNDNTQYFLLPRFIHENKSTFTNQGTAPVGPMHQQ